MYEPTWSQPLENWQPNASFREAATPPIDGPDGGTLVQLPCINVDWLPLVLGSLDQLRNPSTWLDTLSDSALDLVLSRADQLRSMVGAAVNVPCCNVEMRLTAACGLQFSTDGGTTWNDVTDWNANFDACVKAHIPPQVPVPVNPGHPDDNACAVAEWLTEQLWLIAGQKLHDALAARQRVDQFIANIVQELVAFAPILETVVGPFSAEYQTALGQPLSDLATALTDADLEASIRCAIYNATKTVGYVDITNFSAVGPAIAAVSYVDAWVPTMLGNLFNNLGLPAIQALQAENPIVAADCSTCSSGWCHYFDFTLNNQGWARYFGSAYGTYVPGVGWTSDWPHAGGFDDVTIQYDLGGLFAVSEVQVYVSSTTGGGFGHTPAASMENPAFGATTCSGGLTVPMNAPGYTWIKATLGCTSRQVIVDISGGDTSGVTHSTTIAGIQIRGTGTSPFPGNNCIVGP